jgi:alpha-2-macroglobulin
MSAKKNFKLFLLTLLVMITIGCGKEEEPPPTETPLSPTATAVSPTPTTSATPTRSLLPNSADIMLPPKLIGQHPAAGEEAALDGVFELYFDQPMNETETAAALQIVDQAGRTITGEVTWPQPRIMRFKPARAFTPDTKYQATLGKTAVTATGTPLLETLTLDFYTIGNLAVSQFSPAPAATDVAIDSTITVIFNRPVVPLLIAESQNTLPQPLHISPETTGKGEWISTSVYVFRPDEPLIGRSQYSVVVDAAIINAASVTGAEMVANYETSFTVTAPTFNALELVDVTWSPSTNYKDLPLDQTYRLYFDQPMDPAATESAVSFRALDGANIPLQFKWDDTFTTVTITPTQLLALQTRYLFHLSEQAQSSHGGTLRGPFSWQADTVKLPAIVRTEPADGFNAPRYDSTFRIQFASPMDEKSMAGKVIITPEPIGDPDGLYSYWDWSLRIYGFRPSTTYTVQILPGMADPYGNRIENGRTITFTTAAEDPYADLNLPYSLALYRAGGSDAVWVSNRNVSELELGLYQLTMPQLKPLLTGTVYSMRYTPNESQQLWQQTIPVDNPLNTIRYKRIALTNQNEPLAPGIYFITLDSPQVRHPDKHLRASPFIVSTVNVTLKTTATEAMVWVTDLTTGEPVANVPVMLFDDGANTIFQTTTDSDGLVYRDDLTLETQYWETQYYAVIGEPGSDQFGMAISSWNQGISPYDFGINTDFFLEPNQPITYVYTDRPMYRPGQPVYFKGIMRLNDDLNYSLPTLEQVKVEIASYDEVIYTTQLSLSEFGSFTGRVLLDNEAALGGYRITIMNGKDEMIGSGYFDVAEYRKPTFQVEVKTAVSDVAAGETIPVTVDATFFSGGAVVNGDVAWWVLSTDYTYVGEGNLSRFSFNSRERDLGYFYYYNNFESQNVIAEGNGRTDSQGRFVVDIPADLSDEDGSRRFTIERSSVLVHRSRIYPGVAAVESVGIENEPMSFELVTIDWDGKPLSNQTVTVEVVERRWYSVQEEDDHGNTIWRTTVEEIPVAVEGEGERVTGSNGRTTFSFIPPNGGVFAAYVTAQDNQGNRATAATYAWVAGSEYVSWRRVNDHSFELISDSSKYQPGDTAELLIASPFQGDAYALVTVERGHIKSQEVLHLTTNSTIYRLPITAEMAPNVFVSVLVIKGVDETNPAPDFKLGMVQFTVEREEQALTIEVTPDKTVVGPGDTVMYTVRVRDFRGQPVAAEVSLSLSDLAALSIADRTELPILDFFYSERWLSVNTATLLALNMDAYNQELEDQIKGGGGGAGAFGILRIREDFPDTAYWEGQIETGADGDATVSVTLPDNLTTWRMDARAITLDTRVGQTTTDIVSTRPLLVSPQTPRFFVVGDKMLLGTAVHNNTDSSLETAVHLQVEGVTLNSEATQVVTIPAGQQTAVYWEVVVGDGERVDLVFSAQSGEYTDASRPTLGTLDGQGIPIYRFEVPETVGTSGQLLDGGVAIESIGLPIFPNYTPTEGSVSVEVAPSLAAAMTDGLTYLAHYEHECTEQIVSRFLPNLLTSRALQAASINDADLVGNLDEQVNTALQRLYNRQLPDGGWSWWDAPRSNTLVTAYVILSLKEARESGYQVSENVTNQGIAFLRDNFKRADGLDSPYYRRNRQAFLAYVLARVGEPPTHDINLLYETRESMDWYARAYLTQAIYFTDAEDPRLKSMASDFISAATISATGSHWEENSRDYWNWNSDTRTTAIVLDTMIKLQPDNPLVANAVRWLMAHRTNGRWAGTQETAWTLMALTNWMVASGELEADFQYEVALNGEFAGGGNANAATLRDPLQLQFDITELFTDELNRLAIGRTEGSGNLYYTAHLDVSIPVSEVQPLDRGIIISRSYYDPDDRDTPITEVEQGETILARLTIVVPAALHYVVIEDFLPAGLEAIDQSLKTSQQIGAPQRYDWDSYFENGWGWWYFDHVQLRDEKVVLSADYLPAGTYEYVYLVRASLPGEYHVIPPVAQEFYFPEVYGRGAGSMFVVLKREN